MIKTVSKLILKILIGFFAISLIMVILFRFIPIPITPLMVSRCSDQLFSDEAMILSHDWEPLENISPNLQKAVVASEDQRFFIHSGFDFKAIEKAIEINQKGKRKLGASTISQQTAKNVFLWQGRSYLRKGLEAYFTVLIELFWGKERIMEVYLNSIEMGKGVYGAQAAAQHWYRKDAANLTKEQAAGIAAILPNPLKFKASNSSNYINKRKRKIMRQMKKVKLEY